MSSSGLANALDGLADANQEYDSSASGRSADADVRGGAADELVLGEIDDESGEVEGSAPYAAGVSGHKNRPRPSASRSRSRKKANDGLKQVAAPVLITTGLLLLIPAVWAVLQLSGAITSERPDANTMAMAMLIAWPMALILIAAGAWFIVQVLQNRK